MNMRFMSYVWLWWNHRQKKNAVQRTTIQDIIKKQFQDLDASLKVFFKQHILEGLFKF